VHPLDPSLTDSSAIGAAIVAAACAGGQAIAVGHPPEQVGLAPDRGRSSWWEAQASRHESEVARMQTGTCPRPAQ
jgi:hypothetical protein